MPHVRLMYWSMRVMAMLGVAMFLIAAVGAWLYRKQKLHEARWFQRIAIVAIAFPYLAATAGWILTEMGRQPWIVQDLLKTVRRRLAEHQHGHGRDEPHRVRAALPHARDRRLRP